MRDLHWIRHSVRIGFTDYRRTVRKFRYNPTRLLFLGVGLLGVGIGFGGIGVLYAVLLRSMERPIVLSDTFRGTVVIGWALVIFLTQRSISLRTRLDAEAFVLTTVSDRAAVGGLLIAELLRSVTYLFLPTTLAVGIVIYAFRTPLSVLFVPLAVMAFTASAVAIGYVFGFGKALLFTRSRFANRYATELGALSVVVAIAIYLIIQLAIFESSDVSKVAWIPIGWFIDLALLGTPVVVSLGRAVGGLLGALVVILGGITITECLATTYWHTESTVHLVDDTNIGHGVKTLADALSPLLIPRFTSVPAYRVSQLAMLRFRRAPRRLSLLFVVVLTVGTTLSNVVVQTDKVSAFVPPVCALFVPWFAGATFGLNPLGDEGPLLPTTLTSSISGRQFVRGLMLPGLLFGLPLAALSTLVAAIFSPYTPWERLGLVILSVVLTGFATAVAPAVGIRFPRFSALLPGRSREDVSPGLTAMSVYSVLVSGLGGIAIVALLAPAILADLVVSFGVDLPVSWLHSTGWHSLSILSTIARVLFVVILVAALGVGAVAYRYAARSFDDYTLQ
ncbi:hypothetical protein A4G99_19015 [Haladaptatus sp. R4]|uniref:hypothetical protein n=1 Tax=Haladaptatus sp. R4 TaxID=1679489 RepID=UPI0007B496BA|nr:hypothetical protein [Haladaptatus sp. R4]KZN22560.1 hypothetical protein A4G99_19015 [Haladaptatus sp. R4]